MTQAILIQSNGKVSRITINNLQDLNQAVNGYIEGVNLGEHFAYVNEDGISLELPFNPVATALCYEYNAISQDDWIKGNMVVVGPADNDGNDTDVSQNLLRRFKL